MTARLAFMARIVVGAIFVYAAYAKISIPWLTFAMSVDAYQILPDWGVFFVARTLPAFELMVGLWLLAGIGVRWSSTIISLLLAAFLAGMARAFLQGKHMDCGCGFSKDDQLGPASLTRDSIILAMSVFVSIYAFFAPKRSLQ